MKSKNRRKYGKFSDDINKMIEQCVLTEVSCKQGRQMSSSDEEVQKFLKEHYYIVRDIGEGCYEIRID